ncbi:MAG: hypothetical protein ACTHK7_04700, partial [Aureliella sp.]
YFVVFQMPLERQLAQRLAKQQKLEEVARRRGPEAAQAAERLAALQTEERSLVEQLETSKSVGAKLVMQRADRRAVLFQTRSPASLVSQALEVFGRHGLECLDSSPTAAGAASTGSLQSLKPVAELLGGASDVSIGRREVRIKLAGRFGDMQAAVRAMHAALPEIFTVSLEMEAADGSTDRRVWILTISV